MTSRSFKVGALALVVLLVASAGGYWGFRVYASKSATREVIALAAGVTTKVSDELDRSVKALARQAADEASDGSQGGAITGEEARRQTSLIEHVDQQVTALEAHRRSASRDLFDAAVEYVTDARNLLRRIHGHMRTRGELIADLGVLRDLRRGAGTRSETWISEMVSAKKKLDKTAFDYRNGVAALDSSLAAMNNSRRRLAAHVEHALLVREESMAEFRQHLTNSAVRLSSEIESAGTIEPLR